MTAVCDAGRTLRVEIQNGPVLNNLDYWMGEADESARNHIFHYYESQLTAVRMGPWKFHFSTKEDYYANVIPRTVPLAGTTVGPGGCAERDCHPAG